MGDVPTLLTWPKLVLASSSPRRAALLRQVGADFVVRAPGTDETLSGPVPPEKLAVGLARRKALSVFKSLGRRYSDRVILAADTVVSYRHHLMGKPAGPAEARRMLGILSGRTHQVITGVCVIGSDGGMAKGYEVSSVKFRRLSPETIEWYLATGEPMDKAGAYGIQGRGALLVARVEGCYFNIVGLPLALLDRLLIKLWQNKR